MFLDFDIGAFSVQAVHFGDDDRVAAIAGADLPGQTRGATLDAICNRAGRLETFQPGAARAVTLTASRAC